MFHVKHCLWAEWQIVGYEYFSTAGFIRETPIPKAERIGIGKLNNPAKRMVLYPWFKFLHDP
jgi:hypothetical protein